MNQIMIPLTAAKLCLNCDLLYVEGQICPRCSSEQWIWLTKILNREASSKDELAS